MTQVLKNNQSQCPLRFEVDVHMAVTYILHVLIRNIQKSANENVRISKEKELFHFKLAAFTVE